MPDRPLIKEQALKAALNLHWGLEVKQLGSTPMGYDYDAWTFRVLDADDRSWFLKVRRDHINLAGLWAPTELQAMGMDHAVAPVATRSGKLWVETEGHHLILYPYIDGRLGATEGLSDEQWVTYGRALRQVHDAKLSDDLRQMLPRETFSLDETSVLRRVDSRVKDRRAAGAVERELAVYWTAHKADIERAIEQTEVLRSQVQRLDLPYVLCHGDIHTANLIVDTMDNIWIIDWDEAILAPRERDLMFVIDGGITRAWVTVQDEAHFAQGYGPTTLFLPVLAYYRCAWAITDMAAFAQQVCFVQHLSFDVRQRALSGFKSLFEPGNIIDLANQSYEALS